MTFLFKIRIFDKHERQFFSEGEERTEPVDSNWYRFDYFIDINKVQITSFREYILFDSENTPTRCIKIFLSDGDHLYGAYSTDKFVEIYNTEYKTLYTQWAESIGDSALRSLMNITEEPLEDSSEDFIED
jgi:hypothetical protein